MKLEFKGSPQDITVREKLDYTFDLTLWLAAGEAVESATARLTDEVTTQDVTGVISDLIVSGGNKVRLRADWSISAIQRGRTYLIWVKAAIGSQFKEGFARFTTFGL